MKKIETFMGTDGIKHLKKPLPCFHSCVLVSSVVDIVNDAKPGGRYAAKYSAEHLAAYWAVDRADFYSCFKNLEAVSSYILFDDVRANLNILLKNGADEFDFTDAFVIAQKMIHECGRMAESDIAAYNNPAVQAALAELGY